LATAQGSSQCPSGEVVCCNTVKSVGALADLLTTTGLSNAAAANLGLVGAGCSSLTVIGRGKSCVTKQLPMCCTDNNYNGTVSLGCVHINPMLA
ncbi:hypothetical protein OG21DRAFT_1414531, partial [Imleria badia]